jgi:hypothetical protein
LSTATLFSGNNEKRSKILLQNYEKPEKYRNCFAKLWNFLVGLADKPRQDLATVASIDSDARSRQVFTATFSFATHLRLLLDYSGLPIFHSYSILQNYYFSGK